VRSHWYRWIGQGIKADYEKGELLSRENGQNELENLRQQYRQAREQYEEAQESTDPE
jgi:hypothetical protein